MGSDEMDGDVMLIYLSDSMGLRLHLQFTVWGLGGRYLTEMDTRVDV
jgi:hypothetical protein